MNRKKDIIKGTLRQVLCHGDFFTDNFIKHLKKYTPHLQPMIDTIDLEDLQYELMGYLTVVVANLNRIPVLESLLHNLAFRMMKLNLKADDLPYMGEAFIQALQDTVGQNWDTVTMDIWEEMVQSTLRTLRAGVSSTEFSST